MEVWTLYRMMINFHKQRETYFAQLDSTIIDSSCRSHHNPDQASHHNVCLRLPCSPNHVTDKPAVTYGYVVRGYGVQIRRHTLPALIETKRNEWEKRIDKNSKGDGKARRAVHTWSMGCEPHRRDKWTSKFTPGDHIQCEMDLVLRCSRINLAESLVGSSSSLSIDDSTIYYAHTQRLFDQI